MHLALDKSTNDLYKPTGGGVTRVSEGRYTVQQVQTRLKTILGEWILDSTLGYLQPQDFDRNYNITDIEERAREIILTTQGVDSILELSSNYSQRVLTTQFRAKTQYGIIDVTVPWDNAGLQI